MRSFFPFRRSLCPSILMTIDPYDHRSHWMVRQFVRPSVRIRISSCAEWLGPLLDQNQRLCLHLRHKRHEQNTEDII